MGPKTSPRRRTVGRVGLVGRDESRTPSGCRDRALAEANARVGDRRAVRGRGRAGEQSRGRAEARDACRASGARDGGVGATTTRIIVVLRAHPRAGATTISGAETKRARKSATRRHRPCRRLEVSRPRRAPARDGDAPRTRRGAPASRAPDVSPGRCARPSSGPASCDARSGHGAADVGDGGYALAVSDASVDVTAVAPNTRLELVLVAPGRLCV